MFLLARLLLGQLSRLVCPRSSILLENLALRQQLSSSVRTGDRGFSGSISCSGSWHESSGQAGRARFLLSLRWHRAGFRLYGNWLSRRQHKGGRKPISKKLRELIFQMVAENPTWGAPRIHGELLKLGFDISERTVSRWVQRAPRRSDPSKRWKAFLSNHREVIAAMDFFTVPTLTFGRAVLLLCDCP